MIVSVHHYELSESADESDFRDAVVEAIDRDLFENVPGLVGYHIVRGIRGARVGKFAAVWMYRNQDVWEDVWGPIGEPIPKSEYPEAWLVWEDELLNPIHADAPDSIEYTSYASIERG